MKCLSWVINSST